MIKGILYVDIGEDEDVKIEYQTTSKSILCCFQTEGMTEDLYAFIPIRNKDIDAFEDAIVKSSKFITEEKLIEYIRLLGGRVINNNEDRMIVY